MTDSHSIFHHPRFHLLKTPQNKAQKLPHDYYWLDMNPAVMILSWNAKKELRVCKEWRHPVGGWIIGLPGGGLEKGELSLDCAKRELKEEAGLVSDDWRWVGQMRPFPGVANQRVEIWSAFDAIETGSLDLDEGEMIEPFWIDPSSLLDVSQAGFKLDQNPSIVLDGILAACLWMFQEKFPDFRRR